MSSTALIADSGSTKTAWALLSSEREAPLARFTTAGINPVHLSDQQILDTLAEVRSQITPQGREIHRIRFYGSGCRPDQIGRMEQLLRRALECEEVSVKSDLLGACLALSAGQESICCILGTGSASCHFDGRQIVAQTPSLGYILGDEGSGTSLGRRLLADILKRQLPPHIISLWEQEMHIGVAEAIERTYRQPLPNRWLASHTKFLSRHADDLAIQQLLCTEFRLFISRNLLAYNRPDLPINFVGSIAHYFREALTQSLQACGLTLGRIIQAPIEGLIERENESSKGLTP